MGGRPMAGHLVLVQGIGVRIPAPQWCPPGLVSGFQSVGRRWARGRACVSRRRFKSPQIPLNHPSSRLPWLTHLPLSRVVPKARQLVKSETARLRVVGDGAKRSPARRTTRIGPLALRKDEVTIHGRKIAFRTGGWGPLLVLIHGITSNSATWDKVLPKLAKRYTVLAPDLLGHGRSDKLRDDYSLGAHANTIRDLLDALGYRRATIVGHSLGGGVAMQVAYQYPERVDRLVLVAPGGFGKEVSPLLRAASVPGSGAAARRSRLAQPFVQAGTLLTQLLGQLGLHGNTDLEEIGRAYALHQPAPGAAGIPAHAPRRRRPTWPAGVGARPDREIAEALPVADRVGRPRPGRPGQPRRATSTSSCRTRTCRCLSGRGTSRTATTRRSSWP